MCLHCSWEGTGTRQVFVGHIIQRVSKAGRSCCEDVPEDIRAQFEKASSGIAGDDVVEVTQEDAQIDDIFPTITDEILTMTTTCGVFSVFFTENNCHS